MSIAVRALLIFGCTLLLLTTVTAQADTAPQLLRLQTTTFDPLDDLAPSIAAAQLPAEDPGPYYLVQFHGPIEEAWAAQVERVGAVLLGYVPDHAVIAQIAPERLDAIRALPSVRWVGPYRAEYKLAPALTPATSRIAGTTVEVTVIGFPGEAPAVLEQLLTAQGAAIHALSATSLGVVAQATVDAAALPALAAASAVSWIEPYLAPRLTNAEGRKILNVESVWQSSGLFGAGQIIAISDSGLSVENDLSPEFAGRLVRAFAPSEMNPDRADCRAKTDWTDLNGHGTHVAGSVLGNGIASGSNPTAQEYTGSNAGTAPAAQMVFMAMNTDGSPGIQCVPSNGNYIAFGYQNGARISSNSWGSNSQGAYTFNDSVVDDYIWRNRDYLVLFAAGNAGPGPRTIGSPGSAKNIISVGASENNRPERGPQDPVSGGSISDNPNQVAYFSSRGPTSDGRIKPDVVAPGTNILSVLGAAAGGLSPAAPGQPYAFSSGTSMATPLTAGTAAIARAWLTTLRGVANPSAALQKALLINGAAQLAGAATPNAQTGWGRVDLKNTIDANYAVFDDNVTGLRTGGVVSYTVQVAGSSSAGILFAEPIAPAADATLRLQQVAAPASAGVAALSDRSDFSLSALPGYDAPREHMPIPDADGTPRDALTPMRNPLAHRDITGAQPLPLATANDESLAYLVSLVGGGDFEDPAWTQIWSEVWLGAGLPLRSSRTRGEVVINGNHSMWLGGSPSDDFIFYPVSFPRTIDGGLPSTLTFLVDQRDRDPDFDRFCAALVDASGYPFDSGANPLLYCSDNLPGGVQTVSLPLSSAARRELLAGETGYLALFTVGDGLLPHMSAFVDDVALRIDYPDVTLDALPATGPAGTTFLLAGEYNVPYGPVEVCLTPCGPAENAFGTAYADARGDLLTSLTTFTTAVPGTYTIETRNIAGRTARTTFTILGAQTPTLGVAPTTGAAGTAFEFSGTRFLPNDSVITVRVNNVQLGTVGSNAAGDVRFRITTTSNTPAGTYTVLVTDDAGRSAQTTYQVTTLPDGQPTLSVSPPSGLPGTVFRFTGTDFTPNTPVEFTLDEQAVGSTTSDASGGFLVSLTTSMQIPAGTYTLTALQGTRQASTTFQVTAEDGGDGETPPPLSGNGLYITLAWTDPPGQPAAARSLVNNLDLRVEGPGGPYFGNGGSGPDNLNNVETLRLERPAPGTYTIFVTATSVNGTFGAQPFALVATTAQNYGASGVARTGDRSIYLPLIRR